MSANVTELLLPTANNASLASNYTRIVKAQVYPLQYKVVGTIIHALILLMGVFGNVAVVIVVRKAKSMHTPTYCYLTSLAIADFIVLSTTIPEQIVGNYVFRGQYVFGRFFCSAFIFGNFLGINASSLSILCFTIERYVGICHPLLAQKVCSVNRATRIIMGLWTFAVLYSSPWLGLTVVKKIVTNVGEMEHCTFRLRTRSDYIAFFFTDLVLFYILPLLIAVALYARIGIVLYKSSKMRGKRAPQAMQPLRKTDNDASCGSLQKHKDKSDTHNTIKVVRMLLIIVFLFAVLWLPYRGLLVYNSFRAEPWINIWYLLFAKTFVYLNSCINPILYNIMSKRFRQVFLHHIFGIKTSPATPVRPNPRTEEVRNGIHRTKARTSKSRLAPVVVCDGSSSGKTSVSHVPFDELPGTSV